MIEFSYLIRSSPTTPPIDLSSADAVALRYRCLAGDVRPRVDTLSIRADWGWVPVLDFSLSMVAVANALVGMDEGHEVFEFTESDETIWFRRERSQLWVGASFVDGSAAVDFSGFDAAARSWLVEVADDLQARYSELTRNPHFIALVAG